MLSKLTQNKIFLSPDLSLKINDIHWRSQDSTLESVLFYKILPDEKSRKLFSDRIESSQFAWLVVNCDHPSRPINSSVIPEKDWPVLQEEILNELYPLPLLKLFAVTGTNGKTTTVDLVLQIGEICGKKGLSIGTLGVREHNRTILDFGLTTPSFIDIRKFIHRYGQDKDFCVLEASSHALIQKRLQGLQFDMGGWLSFSQDHLDYHKTMEEYFAAKLLLFNYLKSNGHIFIPSSQAELFIKISRVTSKARQARKLDCELPVFFMTSFNRDNLEVAVSIIESAFAVKVPQVFDRIIPPDGRFYIKPYKSNYIIVDYAHTPDALENICRGIREAFPTYRLKVLFGCGGDRDRSKRSQMGRIAEALADEVYITSDNPRSEDPEQIINDIISGMSTGKVRKIIQRPRAVAEALDELKDYEVLLLAGKGHEDHILINNVKHPYSDIKEVDNFLARTMK
jgi:UDP-N-acetylmuramoyl-L-alanyl-D-glutamate--2,6-diaminopimelate ligase